MKAKASYCELPLINAPVSINRDDPTCTSRKPVEEKRLPLSKSPNLSPSPL